MINWLIGVVTDVISAEWRRVWPTDNHYAVSLKITDETRYLKGCRETVRTRHLHDMKQVC